MRCVEKVYAFSVIAAAVLCGGESAFADPALDDLAVTPRSESHLNGGARPEKFLYFSGFDLWRSGGSCYGGLQWAPKGLNEDGFTLKLLLAEAAIAILQEAPMSAVSGCSHRSCRDGGSNAAISRSKFSPVSTCKIIAFTRTIPATAFAAIMRAFAWAPICGGSLHQG